MYKVPVSVCQVYHVLCEEVELRAVEPLAALLAALQHLLPRGEDGASHLPRAHGLLGKHGPRLAGLKHEHWRQKTRRKDTSESH